ncbi:hypothetical protein EJD97_007501 [Solanum chilense]|uniref:Tf2-1-like SH3-like domain-containing protein n=1 Tax=Solanum chilense TaxID=4083 RepID=A0A6N2BMK7_SOLCI|nr:hypothetical protein EJD97_007501 [Solanum chilense]
MGSVAHVEEGKETLVKDVHIFARLGIRLKDSPKGGFMVHHNSESSLVIEVKSKKHLDLLLMELKELILRKFNDSFPQGGDGVLKYQGRLCVPDVDDLRRKIFEEAHVFRYSIHSSATKTYRDPQEVYWLYLNEIVSLHGIPLSINKDTGAQFTSHFWRPFQKGLATIRIFLWQGLYVRRCRSPVRWFEILPSKGVMIFCKKGKHSPRYVSPYEILKRVEKVAYEFNLPTELAPVHPIFHVSMLKKCIGGPLYIFPIEGLWVNENLSYEQVLVEILDSQVKMLRNKEVVPV